MAVGCSTSASQQETEQPAPAQAAGEVEPNRVTPARAEKCSRPVVPRRPWNHKRSALTAKLGSPHHGAADVVAGVGEQVTLRAKFAYGVISKDLQDEPVVAMLADRPVDGDCPSWRRVGGALTDDDGRVAITASTGRGGMLEHGGLGRFPFFMVVPGDDSAAEGAVWALKSGRRAVVFDIDGTLTEGDEAIVEQVLSGESPPPRDGSAEVARRLAKDGALPIYITGRPDVLGGLTRKWLRGHGFPLGPLFLTTTTEAAMPSEEGVQRFKTAALRDLKKRGVVIERAYGNATTDICAYWSAGIPAEATFIVGGHAGEACEAAAGAEPTQSLGSYREHLR
jgi:phosphatidate phosphatase PAH1